MASRSLILFAFCALGLTAGSAAAAQDPLSETAADATAPHPDAMGIAGLMLPVDAAIDASVRVGKEAFFRLFKENPEVAEVENAYPGISAALWPVLEPEIRQFTRDVHPGYLRTIASFYTSRYTPEELKALHVLYAGPTGAKIIEGLYRNAGSDALVDQITRSPEEPVSQSVANEAINQHTGRVISLLTEEDHAAIQAALRVVPAAKLDRANGELAKLVVEWLNKPTPELDARLEAVMEKAMTRYIEEHPPKN